MAPAMSLSAQRSWPKLRSAATRGRPALQKSKRALARQDLASTDKAMGFRRNLETETRMLRNPTRIHSPQWFDGAHDPTTQGRFALCGVSIQDQKGYIPISP